MANAAQYEVYLMLMAFASGSIATRVVELQVATQNENSHRPHGR